MAGVAWLPPINLHIFTIWAAGKIRNCLGEMAWIRTRLAGTHFTFMTI